MAKIKGYNNMDTTESRSVQSSTTRSKMHTISKDLARPIPKECEKICEILAISQGGKPERPKILNEPTEESQTMINFGASCGEVKNVLDGLIRTVLSQHTNQLNSTRSKKALDDQFGCGNYQAIRQASVPVISQVIRSAGVGLYLKKSQIIHQILNQIYSTINPELSLEFIRNLGDSEAMEILTSLKGVGFKTASCVLLLCLGRNFFPVDTHVFRMTKALGWIPENTNQQEAFQHLNATVPDELKYPLHILLIKHSQQCRACKVHKFKPSSPSNNPFKTNRNPKNKASSSIFCPLKDFFPS